MTPDQVRANRMETENVALREQVTALKEILTATTSSGFPPSLRLTHSEEILLGILLKRPMMTREAAFLALYSDRPDGDIPDHKILDIFICKLRKKLIPIKVKIVTVWGRGYTISDEHKKIIEAMMTPKAKIAA